LALQKAIQLPLTDKAALRGVGFGLLISGRLAK